MNKRIKLGLISVVAISLMVTLITGYTIHKRNTFIVDYVREHKHQLYDLATVNGTQIAFLDYYKFKNKSVIDKRLNDIYQIVYDNAKLNISYNQINTDDTLIDLKEYIQISNTTLDGIDYSNFDFKPLYIKEFNENNQHITELDFDVALDTEHILEDIVPSIHKKVDIQMVGAKGKLSNGVMKIVDSGKIGRTIDEAEIAEELEQIKRKSFKEFNGDYTLNMSINPKDIDVFPTEEDLLTITSKISSFSTGYSSSGSSRKTNIAVASGNLNGKILLPGESISVDKSIKSRNAANGYAKAGSYLKGKTVQTYGGGVCQVSTTLYGAVLRAGIIPSTRFAHSMSVGYVPLGLDAAISEGYKDLVFENPYNYPIYIEANANGSTLTFNIWSAEGVLNGYTYQPKSSSSNGGLKAKSWLEKTKGGQVVEKINLFNSSYKPHS